MAIDKTLAWRPVATGGPVAHPCLANLPWIYLGIDSTWRFWFEKGSPMRCRRRASPVRDAENLQRRKSATQKICNAEKLCNAENLQCRFWKVTDGFFKCLAFCAPRGKFCNAENRNLQCRIRSEVVTHAGTDEDRGRLRPRQAPLPTAQTLLSTVHHRLRNQPSRDVALVRRKSPVGARVRAPSGWSHSPTWVSSTNHRSNARLRKCTCL